ncbi:uncharacterized protein LOC110821215 isoform X1 [Carica papaya]|uniref:uncharacterized protein LOC110821215 isoform X1 n=1 Tax=Carica papaya TaxID=3649 RepID=UPI000B8C9DC6|nr:uncharacterized protein LOC110821215 isoform X1 [Carica papaya]XP_021906657.1 uncharacterized protein LOC110821215 isoform X1 [Carica papaya]XP_021906658.1 uncharacterized protein LOC110821215 isoform X1 [Carica papaya]
MDASNACPTEDTLCALLEYLVDPLLPVKSSLRHTPSISQQESVAKQVHAAVLLYNYYHRREYPHLEYLDFESFCKLAGILKPSLLSYMKFMLRSIGPVFDEPEKQLSVMEQTVMDACNICTSLEGLKDIRSIEGWPISKVTVFLVDSKKENCYLQFGTITLGIWSLIEEDTYVFDSNSEAKLDGTHINKKKRISTKSVRDELVANEDAFQQLAFLAIKKATGIDRNDLIIMEGHVVYSLSKEKTAVRFYIMQYIPRKNDERIQIPITDAIHSEFAFDWYKAEPEWK